MDISLFYELETSDTSDEGIKRVYRECIEQVKLADELGYRAVWFTEHHFLPSFSYSSAPEVFLGALARETKDQLSLERVGVLELVHKKMIKTALEIRAGLRALPNQPGRVKKNPREIENPLLARAGSERIGVYR